MFQKQVHMTYGVYALLNNPSLLAYVWMNKLAIFDSDYHKHYCLIGEITLHQTLFFYMVCDPPRTLLFDRDRTIP